jgi:creatinine amidohydrolase
VVLTETTWPAAGRPLLCVPVGSCEQHGPHLPLGTDTIIAEALAAGLAARRPDVVVGPTIAVSASGEHAGFPGTLSVGTDVTAALLVELVRSADWTAGVVLVNGHGGNRDALRSALAALDHDGRAVLAWSPRVPGGDAHAGRTETSLLLALRPDLVRLELAAPGEVAPLATIAPQLRAGGVAAVAPNGVLGDPTGASAAEGDALLAQLAGDLARAVEAWSPVAAGARA